MLPWPFKILKNHCLTIKNPDMIYLLTNVAKTQDVRLDGTIFFGNSGQKDRATFMNKNIPIEYPKLVETYRNPVLRHCLTIKNPDMIYLLTNVAKTQDVRLDGTIFFGNSGQKDRATFMNKNIPIEYPKLVETYRNPVLQHRLTIKNPDMIYLLTNVAIT